MITNVPRLYRWLVAGNIAVFILSVSTMWFTPPILSDDELSEGGYGALLVLPSSVYWLLCALNVVSSVGLMSFVREARWLFLAVAAFQYGSVLFGGVSVERAIETSIGNLNTLLDGAIIVLSFTPPISAKFVRRNPN
jgi:hypothetical protein